MHPMCWDEFERTCGPAVPGTTVLDRRWLPRHRVAARELGFRVPDRGSLGSPKFNAFMSAPTHDYRALDQRLEGIAVAERRIGDFDTVG